LWLTILSSLFEQDSKGFTILGAAPTVIILLLILWFVFKWFKGGLWEGALTSFENHQRRLNTNKNLPDDIDSIQEELSCLREYTGLLKDVKENQRKLYSFSTIKILSTCIYSFREIHFVESELKQGS
jgi:hypothetical protein